MRFNGNTSHPLARPLGCGGEGGWLWTLVVLIVLAIAGCDSGRSLAPVKGKVLLDGQPLTTGLLVAIPPAGRGANGQIQSDGTFELSTNGDGDGAAIGTHKIAVIAYDGEPGAGPEAGYGKLLVPKRYVNPETSGLKVEVKPDEDNYLELRLTTEAVK